MEDNKYYTPTIEEFHVGFEFEYINSENNSWIKSIFDMMDADFMEILIDNETCRVKYLDKEDIESLGWEEGLLNVSKTNELLVYGIGSYVITSFENINHTIDISLTSNFKLVGLQSGLQRIFRGTIKNKSELKKLMKQLGIYEQ